MGGKKGLYCQRVRSLIHSVVAHVVVVVGDVGWGRREICWGGIMSQRRVVFLDYKNVPLWDGPFFSFAFVPQFDFFIMGRNEAARDMRMTRWKNEPTTKIECGSGASIVSPLFFFSFFLFVRTNLKTYTTTKIVIFFPPVLPFLFFRCWTRHSHHALYMEVRRRALSSVLLSLTLFKWDPFVTPKRRGHGLVISAVCMLECVGCIYKIRSRRRFFFFSGWKWCPKWLKTRFISTGEFCAANKNIFWMYQGRRDDVEDKGRNATCAEWPRYNVLLNRVLHNSLLQTCHIKKPKRNKQVSFWNSSRVSPEKLLDTPVLSIIQTCVLIHDFGHLGYFRSGLF